MNYKVIVRFCDYISYLINSNKNYIAQKLDLNNVIGRHSDPSNLIKDILKFFSALIQLLPEFGVNKIDSFYILQNFKKIPEFNNLSNFRLTFRRAYGLFLFI